MSTLVIKDTVQNNQSMHQYTKFTTLIGTQEPPITEIRTEIVYRRDKISVERVIEYDAKTNEKLRILYYDYFNNEKIRAIDEFMPSCGKKYRTVNYVLYKSIDEYDMESGERIRTINYDIRNENKITSIQEYDITTGKIIKVTLYRRDGKTVNSIKEINPVTEHVIHRINFDECNKMTEQELAFEYRSEREQENIANLIDSLYNKKWLQFIL